MVSKVHAAQAAFREERVAPEPTREGLLIVVDVKPEDVDTDMDRLKSMALSCEPGGVGVHWVSAELVPIGYGLQKVVLKGVIGQGGDVDAALEALSEVEGVLNVDLVSESACSFFS